MKNMKSTKRSLFLSAMALLLCTSMLIGTTYAWFTESVSSVNNIITGGNLDVELEWWNATDKEWQSVTKDTDVFTGSLWEPGHTEVVYLKVSNVGDLALKYQLGVNVASETPAVNADGDQIWLSQYIKFGVVESGKVYAQGERAQAIADVQASAKLLKEGYSKSSTLYPANTEKTTSETVALVVYMPETVGNEANYVGEVAPKINLGINLIATQFTWENDSFGNDYDENAAYSVWDGTVPTEMPETLVVDGATQTVHVKDAAAFVYLSKLSADWVSLYTDGQGTTYTNYANGKGGQYYYSGQWSISLEADIDLNNHPIAPVEIMFGQSTGATAFNGNNHTIRNINATTGLFATSTRATFANLALLNVTATNGALIGGANHGINNVTVKNASISGVDYVGGLVGKTYSSIINCVVEDSVIVATGKEAGGLTGYAEANSNGSEISNNIVRGVSVYANNRAAGLAAQVNVKVKVHHNIIDTVTVGAEDLSEYQCGAVVSNALDATNVYDNTVRNADVETGFVLVENAAELKVALAAGGNIVLAKDIALNEQLLVANGTEVTLNLNGKTIAGTFDGTGNQEMFLVKGNLTVKNGTIEMTATKNQGWGAMATIFDVTAGGVLTLDDVVADNKGGTDMNFVAHLNNWGEVTLNVENSTLKATYIPVRVFNSGYDKNNVTIKNSTLEGKFCFWVHNYTAVDFGGSAEKAAAAAARLNLSIYNNGNTFVNSGKAPVLFGFDDTEYYTAEGKLLVTVADSADLVTALSNANANTVINATGVVFEGTAGLNINGATVVGATFKNDSGYAATGTINGTFKNCTFESGEALRWCYTTAGNTVVFENCVINTNFRGVHFDAMNGDVIFKNCEINGFNAFSGSGTMTFENCTFGYDKSSYNGLNIYTNTNLINCTFEFATGKTNFIDMEGTGKTLTITNCTATLDGNEASVTDFVGGSKLAQNTVVVK